MEGEEEIGGEEDLCDALMNWEKPGRVGDKNAKKETAFARSTAAWKEGGAKRRDGDKSGRRTRGE